MKCTHARKLFAAFWDDETTQAEREWLETHFTSCDACRREYETYARTLELIGSLPRLEPSPDLAERALARARRAETAPDRLPVGRTPWVPITAGAAAMLLITLTVAGPWFASTRQSGPIAQRTPAGSVREPVLVQVPSSADAESSAPGANQTPANLLAAGSPIPDSLFDHSEDIEFVLDPVTLHRGRASVSRSAGSAQGERAVITF